MRIAVVDDEPPARERLVALVEELELGEVVGEASNGTEALDLVARTSPDVLLLDIRMPGVDGLEVALHLAALAQPPAVIFTTAYDQHALAAFESQAVDYLLKPVRRERLVEAMSRARRLTRAQVSSLGPPGPRPRTHISASLGGALRLVPVGEVRFFQASQKYVTVGYPGGELIIEESLRTLEAEFPDQLLRIHRNALVAPRHVESLDKDGDARYVIRLNGMETTLEVSRRMLGTVRRRLRQKG